MNSAVFIGNEADDMSCSDHFVKGCWVTLAAREWPGECEKQEQQPASRPQSLSLRWPSERTPNGEKPKVASTYSRALSDRYHGKCGTITVESTSLVVPHNEGQDLGDNYKGYERGGSDDLG
jgi:hypothetical protein